MKPNKTTKALATVQGETKITTPVMDTLPPQETMDSRILSLVESAKPLTGIDGGEAFRWIKDRIEGAKGGLRLAQLGHYSAKKAGDEYLTMLETRLKGQYGEQTVNQMRQVSKNILPHLEEAGLLSYRNFDGFRNVSVAFGLKASPEARQLALEGIREGKHWSDIKKGVEAKFPPTPRGNGKGKAKTPEQREAEESDKDAIGAFAKLDGETMKVTVNSLIPAMVERIGAKGTASFLRTLSLRIDPDGHQKAMTHAPAKGKQH